MKRDEKICGDCSNRENRILWKCYCTLVNNNCLDDESVPNNCIRQMEYIILNQQSKKRKTKNA